MKSMNVRMSKNLHEFIFKLVLEESFRKGEKISMNSMICSILESHIKAYNSAADVTSEASVGNAGHDSGSSMEGTGGMDSISSANDIEGVRDTVKVNGITGVSDVDDAVNTKGAISPNNSSGVSSVSDAKGTSKTDGTRISLTEYIRRALLNEDLISVKDVAKMFDANAASVSAIKCRLRKELLGKGLICK